MKIIVKVEELVDKGRWEEYCDEHGINPWAINEGLMSSQDEINLNEKDAKKYGFLKE